MTRVRKRKSKPSLAAKPAGGTFKDEKSSAELERAQGENDNAWLAFTEYARQDSHRRSLPRLAETLGHNSSGTVRYWSRKFSWQKRLKEFDDTRRNATWARLDAARDAREAEQAAVETSIHAQALAAVNEHVIPTLISVLTHSRVDAARVGAANKLLDLADYRPPKRQDNQRGEISTEQLLNALERENLSPSLIAQILQEIETKAKERKKAEEETH